jgi:hypothetical protein
MKNSTRTMALLGALVLTVAACGTGSGPTADDGSTTSTLAETSTTTIGTGTSTTMPPLTPDQTTVVGKATTDLARRLGVEPGAIVVVSFREVTWRDGSLGCPEPGMSYTEALVEGYQIALQHGDRLFDYHGADDSAPFLCKSDEKDGGREFVPPPGFDE